MASELKNRELQAELPLQAAVPHEMGINGAFDGRKAQAWDERIFQLFPDLFGIGLFVFHEFILEWE